MKIFSALLLAFVLFGSVLFAQTDAELKDFKIIGVTETAAFLVDNTNVKVDGNAVTFRVLSAIISRQPGQPANTVLLDPANFVFATMRADCSTMKVAILVRKGAIQGEKFEEVNKEPKALPFEAESPAAKAVSLVCKTHVGMMTE